jgi:hypothetical protein
MLFFTTLNFMHAFVCRSRLLERSADLEASVVAEIPEGFICKLLCFAFCGLWRELELEASCRWRSGRRRHESL